MGFLVFEEFFRLLKKTEREGFAEKKISLRDL
jgi:hypothetical protein